MARLGWMLIFAAALAACGSVRGPGTKELSFASMQMLNEGVDGEWIRGQRKGAGDEVAALHDSLVEVLGELALRERRPLAEWTGPIRAYLETVYAEVELHPHDEPVEAGFHVRSRLWG